MYLDKTLIRKGTVYSEHVQRDELVGFMDLAFLQSNVCTDGEGFVYAWGIRNMPIAVVSDNELPRGVHISDLREAFLAAPRKLHYARELLHFYNAQGVLMRMHGQDVDMLVFDPNHARMLGKIFCDVGEHTRIGY